jgi:hypothetical protein
LIEEIPSWSKPGTNHAALLKYADFGVSTFFDDSKCINGCTTHLSPEWAQQNLANYDHSSIDCFASDIYQVGLVLFEIFIGEEALSLQSNNAEDEGEAKRSLKLKIATT